MRRIPSHKHFVCFPKIALAFVIILTQHLANRGSAVVVQCIGHLDRQTCHSLTTSSESTQVTGSRDNPMLMVSSYTTGEAQCETRFPFLVLPAH
ncbi:hypothetical protein NPIL_136431 [Nephila pilipes]|uniref:Secreted protein n=1 Tax=Nephila pilipes TaxID=299642 RepID=A0A8X6QU64_NEPPI|nr:hypothetical protein NPIL_136431 [Nephila pilipes]